MLTTSSVSIICDTEDLSSPTKPSSMSPQAPQMSPITPQRTLTTEPDYTSHSISIPFHSVDYHSKNITTPCLLIATNAKWAGFKIIVDNIDMNVRQRHQTFDRYNLSITYLNAYAIRDRLHFSGLKKTLPTAQLSTDELLPT